MSYRISDRGEAFIKSFEKFRAKAYLDAVGIWTCGWGHTSKISRYTTCTEQTAEAWFKEDCAPGEAYLNSLGVKLTQTQVDALMSFIFNLGLARFKMSTLCKLVKHSAPADMVAREFRKWVYGTDRRTGKKTKLGGLVKRRDAEANLYQFGRYE